MTTMLRFGFFGLLLTALALPGHAQVVGPLTTDPSRVPPPAATGARRTAVLSLPFFDDFTLPLEGAPAPARWETKGGALINNRFPVAPPSRGVATLDGLRANGQPYGSSSLYGATDTLTSQPLNLSGLTAADNVYLSFYWQSGSVAGAPRQNSGVRPVALQLEFRDANQNWQPVWQQLSTGARTGFQQQLIAVTQTQYLHGAFQFRFRAVGNLGNTQDAWSIDYVLLDRNRTATATSYRDIATSAPLTSLLKRYAAMPVWQYNAAPTPANELNDQVTTTVNNLDTGVPTPINWVGTVQVLPGGTAAPFVTGIRSLNPGEQQDPIVGSLRNAPLPVTAEAKRIRHQLALQTNEAAARTLPNDTISRVTELSNYYAYDDGTAEGSVYLTRGSGGPPSYFVYRIDLNKPDQVQGLRLYPLPSPTATSQNITVALWADTNGQPSGAAIATRTYAVPTTLPTGQSFVDINFAAPTAVSGTFYLGFAPTGDFLQIGADFNSTVPAGYLLAGTTGTSTAPGTWNAVLDQPYAPMMRPLLTNGVTTSTGSTAAAAALTLYPNPSTGVVRVAGRYRSATVLDALGRVVWQQPAPGPNQETLDLRLLPAGVYLVRLAMPDNITIATKRLVITKP